jgi:hypothetical protein
LLRSARTRRARSSERGRSDEFRVSATFAILGRALRAFMECLLESKRSVSYRKVFS